MKPLSNIKVLDLSRVLAGPFCTMILNDLGAEIIKVEVPETGDDSRGYGPFINGQSAYFISINHGKKSISLNLKSEKGKKILLELVKKTDVLVENFRPGTMEKLGLGYEFLKTINPKLIYAATSGYGHTGPDSKKPGYDILVQAAGVMGITGWPDMPPTRVGLSVGDLTGGLYLTIGTLTALYHRTMTGEGQKIDISLLDCQVAILENAIMRYQVEKKNPEPIGNRHPTITPFQAYKASDAYFVVGVGSESLWKTFCDAIHRDDLTNEEMFATNKKRTENLVALNEILDPIFAAKTAKEWLQIFEKSGVPCAPINTIDKLFDDEQLKARNMIVNIHDPKAGDLKIAGNPIKMTSIPEKNDREAAPEIGQDNVEIFTTLLGMDKATIEQLKNEGVI